eukprot:5659792-Amphidinium_carterae.1
MKRQACDAVVGENGCGITALQVATGENLPDSQNLPATIRVQSTSCVGCVLYRNSPFISELALGCARPPRTPNPQNN